MALGAEGPSVILIRAARPAVLKQQLSALYAIPVRLSNGVRSLHRYIPNTSVMDEEASAAVPCETAIFASGTCRSPHSPRRLAGGLHDEVPVTAVVGEQPPVRVRGEGSPQVDVPAFYERAPSPGPQKPMFSNVTIAVLVNES